MNELTDATTIPTGTIVMTALTKAPYGWAICDGSQEKYQQDNNQKTNYTDLYKAIGGTFGPVDTNEHTFYLPDLRGRFIRGYDDRGATGRDPDYESRKGMQSGNVVGAKMGSIQDDQFKSHTHPYNKVYAKSTHHGWGGGGSWDRHTVNTSDSGGNETRPINVYLNFMIKL